MPSFTTSDGLSLHYEAEGEGIPILCLAGLTRTARDFDYVAPHLAGYRLIRLDYRGRGQSDWADAATYAVPVEARDALELLDHLGVARAGLLGTSRGGLIALTLAAQARDRLRGVAFNDIGPEIAPEGLAVIKDYVGRNPPFRTIEEAVEAQATKLKGFAGVPRERWREETLKQYREGPDGLQITYDPALRQTLEGGGEQPAPDLWPLFDALEGLPLALIRGANSDLLSPATAAEMRRRRPDMIFAEIPDRGHIPFLDEPPAVAALQAWAARL